MSDYIRMHESPRYTHESQEVERLIAKLIEKSTITDDGVIRWNTNDSVPPADIVEFAKKVVFPAIDVDACTYARKCDTAAFLDEYQRNQRPATDEERFEMRAAFGPGTTVVDCITGRRTTV